MKQKTKGNKYYTNLRPFAVDEKGPCGPLDAMRDMPARVPSRHSNKVVHSFDGGLELILWSDPAQTAAALKVLESCPASSPIQQLIERIRAYKNEEENTRGAKLPKLGRDILELWSYGLIGRDGVYSSVPVDLVKEYPETFGGLPTDKLVLYPFAVNVGQTHYIHLDDAWGNVLYFRLNSSDNWPCFRIRFSADYMESLINKDVAGKIAAYMNALFSIDNAGKVFELSRVDYAITYDTGLTLDKVILKIQGGLYRCRLKARAYVQDDASGDSVTLGKGGSGYQVCCYDKGAELMAKGEYERCGEWFDRLEMEEVGTLAVDPLTGKGGGVAPHFYRLELRLWRDMLVKFGICHLEDLQTITYRGLFAELFKLLSRKCTNDAYSDIDPEYAYLFDDAAAPSAAGALRADAPDGAAVLEDYRARARSVRMFKKLRGLPASLRSIRSASSMLAKHIGTNKNPLLAFRLVFEDFLPKVRDFAPADFAGRIDGAIRTLWEFLENDIYTPEGA